MTATLWVAYAVGAAGSFVLWARFFHRVGTIAVAVALSLCWPIVALIVFFYFFAGGPFYGCVYKRSSS